jgi:hypothetical protein
LSAIKNFLLIFDHSQDRLISQEDFGTDAKAALESYSKAEARYRDSSAIDIVLVGSDSIETVKVTHSTYFTGFGQRSMDDLHQLINR